MSVYVLVISVAKRPCGSCPYRTDVPSGVWSADEYDKLPEYDRETALQPIARFDCHQRDGCLCAGWLACHGSDLLSVRLGLSLFGWDPALLNYKTDVPVFGSGQEACDHGKRDIDDPGRKARKLVAALEKKSIIEDWS